MKLTDKIVRRFGEDKVMHFLLCGLIEAICCFFGVGGMLWGLVAVLSLSAVKEALDDTIELGDIIAGLLGGIVAGLIYLICLKLM